MGLTGLQIHKDSGSWDSDARLRVTLKNSPSHISESTRQLAVMCLFPERATERLDPNKVLSWPQESHVIHELSEWADQSLQAIPKLAYCFFKLYPKIGYCTLYAKRWCTTQTNQVMFWSQLHHVSPHWHLQYICQHDLRCQMLSDRMHFSSEHSLEFKTMKL